MKIMSEGDTESLIQHPLNWWKIKERQEKNGNKSAQ